MNFDLVLTGLGFEKNLNLIIYYRRLRLNDLVKLISWNLLIIGKWLLGELF